MENIFNVGEDVPEYLKHEYQEGNAKGLKLECGDGGVESETTVPMYKSRFLRLAITKKRRAEGLSVDDEVVLKYRRFETKTMKYFVDALYLCNVQPIPLPEILKLLQLMSKMGFTETVKGRQDFKCTAKNVQKLLSCLEDYVKNASVDGKIDIAFTISHFPDEGIQGVLNKCLENVTAKDVRARAFLLQHGKSDLSDTNFVHDLIRLCLEDDQDEDATEDQVTSQIVQRASNIANQLEPPEMRKAETDMTLHTVKSLSEAKLALSEAKFRTLIRQGNIPVHITATANLPSAKSAGDKSSGCIFVFDKVLSEHESGYDPSTGKLTATKAGFYNISCFIKTDSSYECRAYLYNNEQVILRSSSGSSVGTLVGTLKLEIGDVIYIKVDAGRLDGTGGYSSFSAQASLLKLFMIN